MGDNLFSAPPPESVRQALTGVLQSDSFARSSRLSRFLRFVVERALAGDEESLKEYTIGLEVFDRGDSFDPRTETIVRVEARRLRNQLSEYYGSQGRADTVRIEVPKGGYRPIFHSVAEPAIAITEPRSPDPRTIVVLPFADMSAEHDQAYLCDGLTEEVTHALTQVPWLRVIARTSAFAFKEENVDIRQIGSRLGAGIALEGSIRTDASRVRVTVQMIDTTTGRHFWSERYDRELDNVFAVQDTVTTSVVGRLEASHKVGSGLRRETTPDNSVSFSAYSHYLQGRRESYRYTRESLASAVELFKKCIGEAPDYASPWAGLAEAYTVTAILGWARPADTMPRAKQAARRALEIDPGASDAHAALALVLFRYDYEWEEAEKAFRRGLELSPGSGAIRIWYSSFLFFQRRPEEAIREARLVSELDPLSNEAQRVVADTLYFCRRFDETIEQCNLLLSQSPDYYFGHFYKGLVLIALEQFSDGVDSLTTADRVASSVPLTRAHLGWSLGVAGKRRRARAILTRLTAERERSYFPAFFLAMVCVGLGETDKAFDWLEQAFADRDSLLPILEVDAIFDPIRSDARCTDILERIGLG